MTFKTSEWWHGGRSPPGADRDFDTGKIFSTCIFDSNALNFKLQLYPPDAIHQVENNMVLPAFSNNGGYKIRDQYATYFLTFTIVGWVDVFTRKQCSQILINSFDFCQKKKGLILYAFVIMSNHVHILASAHPGSPGLSAIIRDFKSFTSKEIIKWITNNPKESRRAWLDIVFRFHGKHNPNNQLHQVWIQNNHPVECITPMFTLQKLNYIHNNPVKAGIVDLPEEFRLSSARNYTGRKDTVLDVTLLDYGPLMGYIGY